MLISTDGRASLPAKAGQAEILNSSLEKYPELTLCARLLTHSFSRTFYGWPTQALISYGSDPLLGSFVTRSCDQFYEGCTKVYRDLLSRNHIPWIAGSVWLCRDGLRNDEILLVSTFENMETRMSLLFFSEPMSFYVFRVTPIFSRYGHRLCGTQPVSVPVLPRVTTGVTSMVTLSGR